MSDRQWHSAIVVGASSGIGEAVARRLAAGGTRVTLVARREERLRKVAEEIGAATSPERVAVRVHDVRDGAAVPALWDSVERESGPVDVLVFASGVMPAVGPSEYEWTKDREIVEVNLLGAMAWLGHAALRMEAARRGTIVGVSSVAGDRGRRGMPAYAASKAGLNCFLEALRNRLATKGVDVVTVRPGYVATPMTEGLGLPAKATISADRAAELILRAARSGPVDRYVPRPWGLVMCAIRAVPSWIFRRLAI
jgi:decaprenylphospho-beta-D-erythro-pentofuranosid-2-ulose 2-reductase